MSDASSDSEYEDVLIPTDGSEASEPAIEHGVSLATTLDATIHALYVVDTRLSTSVPLLQALRTEGNEAIDRISRRAKDANLEIEPTVVEGTPHNEILTYVDDRSIDLISMGTHGRRESTGS